MLYPGERAVSRARRVFLDEAAAYFRTTPLCCALS